MTAGEGFNLMAEMALYINKGVYMRSLWVSNNKHEKHLSFKGSGCIPLNLNKDFYATSSAIS